MERLPLEEYDPQGIEAVGKAGRAIPGQSLTNDPDSQYPWEGAPQFTNFKEALDYTVGELIDEDVYVSVVSGIGQGVPISDVAMQVLYAGFKAGKWNPDLMLMLIEPLMYILIALCEKAGVEYTLYNGEEDDEEDIKGPDTELEQVKDMLKTKVPNKQSVSASSVPQDILEKVENVEISPSLLAPQNEPEQTPPSNLLGRTE
mgnify:CR=1 FL=1